MDFLSIFRLSLYCLLWVFSVVLLITARIQNTGHLSFDVGRQFDPIVAGLLATGIFLMLWSMFAIHAIYTGRDHLIVRTLAAEGIALFTLFLMWLVGTGITAVLVLFLLGASLVHSLANRA